MIPEKKIKVETHAFITSGAENTRLISIDKAHFISEDRTALYIYDDDNTIGMDLINDICRITDFDVLTDLLIANGFVECHKSKVYDHSYKAFKKKLERTFSFRKRKVN